MDSSLEQEIVSLVALYKAHMQRRLFLQGQISNLKIQSSFFKSNQDWRRNIEIVPRIKYLKQTFTKYQDFSRKILSSYKPISVLEPEIKETLQFFDLISDTFDKIQSKLIDCNQGSHELNFLKYSLTEKLKKKEQADLIHKKNILNLSDLQLNSTKIVQVKADIVKIKEKLLISKENLKKLSIKQFQRSSEYVKDIKCAELVSSLSTKHLILRSKWLLKAEIINIVDKANAAYDKYTHFLMREKRKLQKLSSSVKNEKDDSKISAITGSRTLSYMTNIEFFQSFRSISPIKFSSLEDSSRFNSLETDVFNQVYKNEGDEIQSDLFIDRSWVLKEL